MKPLGLILVLAVLIASLVPVPAEASPCQFLLGFKTLHDKLPGTVGSCKTDQHYNPQNGDALQETTKGLLVWRKADNFTAFTDGYGTWVNGPYGVQGRLNTERFDWELRGEVPAGISRVIPSAAPILAPRPTPTVFVPPLTFLPPSSYPCNPPGLGCGEVSQTTGRVRDQYVSGYYRKDGTYVRPYYRSRR